MPHTYKCSGSCFPLYVYSLLFCSAIAARLEARTIVIILSSQPLINVPPLINVINVARLDMNGSRIKKITRKSKQTFKSHTIIYNIFDLESYLNPNSIEESTKTIVAAASPPLPAYNAPKEKPE